MSKKILKPDRVRKIKGSFAFVEHRFLRDGFFENLTHNELLLYFFLTIVSNRSGVSWYGYDRICSIFRWMLEEYLDARDGLINKDLVAFDGYVFQVLDLPEKPIIEKAQIQKTQEDIVKVDPAALRNLLQSVGEKI